MADSVSQWVWSGFYAHDDIGQMIDDIVDDDCDVDELKSLIGPRLGEKQTAERSWPGSTDCDRLDKVFYCLHECAIEGCGVMIAFGDLADDEARSVQVGQLVADALRQAHFQVQWDGSTQTRINLSVFDWSSPT